MPKIAVILVPGIMGSPLMNNHGREAWPVHEMRTYNVGNLYSWVHGLTVQEKVDLFVDVNGRLRSITYALPAAVGEPNTLGRDTPDNWARCVAFFYYDFIVGLRDRRLKGPEGEELKFSAEDYVVHVVNYDWSRPILESVQQVISDTWRFCTVNRCERFIYLTHSMGGIVAMAALCKSDWIEKYCLGVVRVVCPVLGAPETMARLVRGIEHSTFEEKAAAQMLGDSGKKFSLFAACVQGLASLLPAQNGYRRPIQQDSGLVRHILAHHFENEMEPSSDDDETLAYKIGSSRFDELASNFEGSIRMAETLRAEIISSSDRYVSKTRAVVLVGKETVQKYQVNPIVLNGKYVIQPKSKTNVSGDGTVPLWSQIALAVDHEAVFGGIDHADAFADKRVWPHIIAAMNKIVAPKSEG